jgi:hypothetical protein
MEETTREEKRRLRAYYLWEADGRPEGRAHEYWLRAGTTLDDEDVITAPIDEATAARSLLTKPPTAAVKRTVRKKVEAAAPEGEAAAAVLPKARAPAKRAKAVDSDGTPASKKAKVVKKINGDAVGAASPARKSVKKPKDPSS